MGADDTDSIDPGSEPSTASTSDSATPSKGAVANPEADEQRVLELVEARFSGPLPPPSILAGYEAVKPGTADRIIRMAEEQGSHRRQMERQRFDDENRQITRGQYLAFGLVFVALVTGGAVAIANPSWTGNATGALIGMGGLGSIVAVFITRRRSRAQASQDRNDR